MTSQPPTANAAQAPPGNLLPNPKARLKDQFHELARKELVIFNFGPTAYRLASGDLSS
jgi:hypothetical protein